MRYKLKPFTMFFHMIWTHVWLSLFHYSWSFVCVSFHVFNMVAKFLLSRLCLSWPCFKFFDLSTQCFIYMIKIVMVQVTSKIISFVITYLLEDEQELSLGMLIRPKCIYNFWCSMLVFTPFALCFVTLRGVFIQFPKLTYWQDATVPCPCFLLFLCFRKATQEIFSELDKISSRSLIFPRKVPKTKREPEGGQRPLTQQGGAAQPLAAPTHCEGALAAPWWRPLPI
jgi:hypothetical protein